jgi:phosphoglycerol transferase MdoB-like AlkP superfamily enzyme
VERGKIQGGNRGKFNKSSMNFAHFTTGMKQSSFKDFDTVENLNAFNQLRSF